MLRTVPIGALVAELDAQPEAFDWNLRRQQAMPPQRHTRNVLLRGCSADRPVHFPGCDWLPAEPTRYARHFPCVLGFAQRVAECLQGALARATLVELAPRSQVYPHADRGAYYRSTDRLHLVLRSASGSPVLAGGDQALLREGELWVIDNRRVHASVNPASTPRVHLVFDVLPVAGCGFFVGALS